MLTPRQQLRSKPIAAFTPMGSRLLQRKCACGNDAQAHGECAECGKNKSALQRKLAVAANNEPLEGEADRVAEQVSAVPINPDVTGAIPRIQRYIQQSSEQSEQVRASVGRVLASAGTPLDIPLRKDMESRFGHD